MTAWDYSPKQKAAIAAAPKEQKAKLKSLYASQSAATKSRKALPAKRQPRRKAGGKPKPMISTVLHGKIFSPLDPRPIPTLLSEGMALPYTGLVRAHISAGTNCRSLHVLANTGLCATLGVTVENCATPTLKVHAVPTLSNSGTAGGPTSGRAMKASIALGNVTQKLHRMGRVYIINAPQRVSMPAAPSAMTQAQWDTFMDKLIDNPKARAYDGGSDFDGMKEIITYPTGQAEYSEYNPWEGGVTADRFFSNIAEWPGLHTDHPHINRPMSTVFVMFDTVGHHQDYSMSLRSAHYLRYPLDTVAGQVMKPVPTAPSDKLNQMRDSAERAANTLKNISDSVSAGMTMLNIGRSALNFAEEMGEVAIYG